MEPRLLAPEVRAPGAKREAARRPPLPAFWLPLLAVLAWTGCNPKPEAAAGICPVGSFALVSVDGNKVPYTVQHGRSPLTIKSGTFVIGADGTCISKIVFSPPSGREASREVKATYTRQGPTLTMKWEGAGTTTGTIEGDTFTMNNEGMTFSYRK